MTESQTGHLKRIAIKGFKSIGELELNMQPVNILIGANGAGKSNFISVFTFLSHLSQGKLRNYVEMEGGAERFFHFGTRQTPSITIELEVENNGYYVEFSPNLDDDSLVFNKEYCTFVSSSRKWQLYPAKGESGFVSGQQADSGSVKFYTRS